MMTSVKLHMKSSWLVLGLLELIGKSYPSCSPFCHPFRSG
ncbi:hypothetical protein LINPERPRIM_LOCUS33177 [Linum perenne]